MPRRRTPATLFACVLSWLAISVQPAPVSAGEALIAVAANFIAAANRLGAAFTERTGHNVRFSFGSTGRLFAQIVHGAPFAVFLAADAERPARVETRGLAVPGSRFTYAIGRLVLLSIDRAQVVDDGAVLQTDGVTRLAIANPETAPYGAAALDVLRHLGVYDRLHPTLVRGDNVAQALQFVVTGHVPLGFVALAQMTALDPHLGSTWIVPTTHHRPIRQDAVLLRAARGNPTAAAFLDFLRTPIAHHIIRASGYLIEASHPPSSGSTSACGRPFG